MNKCFVIGFCYCAYQLLVIKICHALTYTDQWAVHITGGEEIAKRIADKHGFTFLDEIMPDYYHFHHRRVSKRSIYPSSHIHHPLSEDPAVHWAEQQIAKKRVKRDIQFDDPKWPRMWYLNRGRMLDMNVLSAWEKGITGRGVRVTILDDGIERDHPDLKKNYDPDASYDVNGHDRDPTPRYDYTNENRHGTRCAGEVAAEANNGVCSVGVAYNAGIGGVRMLDGDVTDAVEARSLSHNPQHIDIYSASWGPDDDGQTVDGPAPLAKKAFEDGITKGRNGKGSIFVWASGNGGRDGDSCNCDGYTNSIYTLSISSTTENGNVPWYSEACSSTLTTTYSSGSGGERQIVTTDLRKDCTEYHTGTSASAPLAAGICALVLEANPGVTWRDLQHIVVETARPLNLKTNDWITNGVGKKVSHHFGFGLMDASAMVDRALNWTNVPEQHQCEIKAVMPTKRIGVNSAIEVTLESNGCHGSSHEVLYLEHVQAILTLGASRRGQVQIFLTSPSGTRSTLLAKRTRDSSAEGFTNWAFMTTHNWGEISMGRWTLRIENAGATSYPASLNSWTLILFGTDRHPYHPTTTPPTTTTNPQPPPTTTTTFAKQLNGASTYNRFQSWNKPNHIVHVGPCRKPTPPSRSDLYTPHPRVGPDPRHPPVISLDSATTIGYNTLDKPGKTVLRNWSLVLHGTATHPQAGNNAQQQAPKPNEECAEDQVVLDGKCRDECPSTFYAVNQTYTLPRNATDEESNTTENDAQPHFAIMCLRCDKNCFQCYGPSQNDCTVCTEGFQLVNSSCSYKEDILDYFRSHKKGTIIGILALCGVCALLVFLTTFAILQCHSHGFCKGWLKKSLDNGEDYVTNYRRPDDARISLGGKNMNLRNGNPEYHEYKAQEEGLLARYETDEYEDDFEEDVVNFEHVPRNTVSKI